MDTVTFRQDHTKVKLFEGKTLAEQKALMATLERAGTSLYHAFAKQENNPKAHEAL